MASLLSISYADDDCINCSVSETQLSNRSLTENIEQLNQVSELNKERVDLLDASVSYGFLGVGVGRAKIYLTISEGKIVDLNVDAKVGILGINSEVKKKVTIDRLMRGQPLEFYLDGADQPSLRIRPSAGFSETGGSATVEIWDGEEFQSEDINITSRLEGEYKIYKDSVARSNEVTGLKINMRGMSIPSMYVNSYKIETR
tara:strand:+ start:3568 stop:4170 length:603 start_codon:yes stop_codon:yes gene_type:complete